MTTVAEKLEQLDDDELDALIELAQARANSHMSKREFLKAAGVLGAGAAIGGGGAAALTQDAQAAASTTDGDGDVGTPSDPVDVFFEGAEGNSVTTGEQLIDPPSAPFSWEGLHTLLHNGYCVNSRGRVFSGSTAPQDAIDDLLANANGGQVWLGNSVDNLAAKTISGQGAYDSVYVSQTNFEPVKIVGMGWHTLIDGGTTNIAYHLEDPNGNDTGTARWRGEDFRVVTDSANGTDAFRLTNTIENNYRGITVEFSGLRGVAIVGGKRGRLTDFQVADTADSGVLFVDSASESTTAWSVTGFEVVNPGNEISYSFKTGNGNTITDVSVNGGYQKSGTAAPWLNSDGSGQRCVVDSVAGTSGSGGTTLNGADILVGDTN